MFHPEIYHEKKPYQEDSEYFEFFPCVILLWYKAFRFCCQWIHGFICFYLHCENWVLLQHKTGIQVPQGSTLMYIKNTFANSANVRYYFVLWWKQKTYRAGLRWGLVPKNCLKESFGLRSNYFTQNVHFSSGGILVIKPAMFKCCCRQCPLLCCTRKRRDQMSANYIAVILIVKKPKTKRSLSDKNWWTKIVASKFVQGTVFQQENVLHSHRH